MRILLLARGWIALSAVLGSTAAVAVPPAEQSVPLPNAADPKPDSAGSQDAAQAVIVTLEKRSTSSSNSQLQSQQTTATPGKPSVKAAPFHKPERN